MPSSHEKPYRLLPYDKDRRRKLTPAQRDEIRTNPNGFSQRELAACYGVSRRLIQFISDPKKHAENLLARQQRGGSKRYYGKDRHRVAMQETRAHRKAVFKKEDNQT